MKVQYDNGKKRTRRFFRKKSGSFNNDQNVYFLAVFKFFVKFFDFSRTNWYYMLKGTITGCPLCQECQECQETSGIGQNVRKLSGEIMFFRKMSGLSGNCEFFSKYQNSLFVFYEFEGKRSLLLICNICSSGTSRNAFSKNLRLRRAACVFVCEEVCCGRVSNQP